MITTERAAEAVQRLINSHFGNDNRARCSIPANRANDDDLVASDFVQQQAALRESHARLVEVLSADIIDNAAKREALRLARELKG